MNEKNTVPVIRKAFTDGEARNQWDYWGLTTTKGACVRNLSENSKSAHWGGGEDLRVRRGWEERKNKKAG